MKLTLRLSALVPVIGLLLAACGGGASKQNGSAGTTPTSPTNPSTTYSLAVTIGGTGTVTSSPAGINCSSAGGCSGTFASGLSVTLSAAPGAGYGFSGWSGSCVGTAGSCTVTMNSAQSVRATFVASAPVAGAPLVLYTDLASGPNSGGENNNGTYLSIFGKNFGTGGLGTTVKVTIGGVEVAGYRYLGGSKGRTDMQQITVQVGGLGSPAAGTALPVQVTVNGTGSNTDQTFTVNPGRMLFVDNVKGSDSSAVADDITHPYRHVQNGSSGAFDVAVAGDVIVMRGTGTPWTDFGNGSYFIRFIGKNGTAPSGSSGSGPFTLLGYPTEDVFINLPYSSGASGAITGVNTTSYAGGRWITISNLRVEAGGPTGPIALQIAGDHWRIVNNELTASTATSTAKAAGINGNGTNSFWVGNHVHNIAGSTNQENHAIYIDGDGSYEVAYNLMENVTGGSGFQIYVNGGNGSTTGNNVNFHHNLVHDVSKYGINIADGSQNNIVMYDNVVYNIAGAGLRFNTITLHGARIYNNTFYNTNTDGNSYYGIISNDWNLPSDALDMENNIFVLTSGSIPYTGGSTGMSGGVGTVAANLYFGGAGTAGFDSAPVSGDPKFANAAAGDLHLTTGSPAIDAGSSVVLSVTATDYDATTARLVGAKVDLGAFEFH